MSTLTVTNIKATGETASRAVSGVAAAWVLYNQSSGTATISDSFGLSSISDGATGRATINYTNAFSSVQYSPVGSAGTKYGVSNNIGLSLSPDATSFATSATTANTRRRDTNADVDIHQVTLNAHGDLA